MLFTSNVFISVSSLYNKTLGVLEYKGFIRNGLNTDIEIMSLVKLVTL